MSIKDDRLSFKDKQNIFVKNNDNQYSNLNLNQYNQCLFNENLCLHNASTDKRRIVQKYDLKTCGDSQLKKGSNSWNKSNNKHLSPNFLNINYDSEQKNGFKDAKSANNSTLSLHIVVYENLIEADSDAGEKEEGLKKKDKSLISAKQFFPVSTSSKIQNPFEFPRQQENVDIRKPEITQFKASQKLLNPNKKQVKMNQSARVPLLKKNQTQRPEQRLDIYTKIRHKNTLPEVPMEPRFLQLPFMKLSRFAEYKTTQLEKNYRFELVAERDLDINVDLVDAKRYIAENTDDQGIPENMDPIDQYLIEEEAKAGDKRRANHNEVVSWMRKIQYLGVENARFGVGADRQETKVGYKLFKSGETDQLYKDRQTQINAINKSFEDVNNTTTKHPTKKGVHAVEEFPLLPDFDFWQLPFSQVLFDSDPIPLRNKNKEQIMERAIIQGLTDNKGASFVAYYAPTDDSLEKLVKTEKTGEHLDDDDRLEYKLGREYIWSVRNEATRGFEPNYFFCFRDGKAFYNCMDTRVKLTRRVKSNIPERMLVKNDEINENDRAEFERRLLQISEREFIDDDETNAAPAAAATTEADEEQARRDEEEEIRKAKKAKTKEIFGEGSDSSGSSSSSNDSDSDEASEVGEGEKKAKSKSSSGSSSSAASSDEEEE